MRVAHNKTHPTTVEIIRDMWKTGVPRKDIAAFAECSEGVVQGYCKDLPSRRQLKPHIIFKGRKYTKAHNGYWQATTMPKTLLHRDMWEDANGPIPPKHEVNHIDHNPDRNELSNFELLNKVEHGKETRRYHCNKAAGV